MAVWKRDPAILLCPNVPKPLHGVNPRTILGDNWWNRTRREAYASTNYRCKACGVHKTKAKYHAWLEGHEWYIIDYEAGLMTYTHTVPLCHFCHNYIHDGRMRNLLRKGDLHHSKYAQIIKHGDEVLRQAGLSRLSGVDRDAAIREAILDNRIARWDEWRLSLFGKLYPPKYKDAAHWEQAFR